MSYVPVIIPPTASARAQDLARQLEQYLSDYRRQHPSTSDTDIQQALQLVVRRQPVNATLLRVVLALGVLMVAFGAFFFLQSGDMEAGGSSLGSTSYLIVAIAAAALILAVAFGLKGSLGKGEQSPTVLVVSGVILLLFLGVAAFVFLVQR